MLGQGSLYILEKKHKVNHEKNGLQTNGPVFKERVWNSRPLDKAQVAKLLETNGGRLYPKWQEYAIVIAVSNALVTGAGLADYQSHNFPKFSFNADPTGMASVYIVNGHHRIEGWILRHQALLNSYTQYQQILTKADSNIAGDHDTSEILDAREKIESLEKTLFDQGCWGAIILDYGQFTLMLEIFMKFIDIFNEDAIIAHKKCATIQAHWSRNNQIFHLPDAPSDLLDMILKSVNQMSTKQGAAFLEDQLLRTGKEQQSQLRSILRNPQLLYLFANLKSIPMFEAVALIKYTNLYKWNRVVGCWLEAFLAFGMDSYRFLCSKPDTTFQMICDSKQNQSSDCYYDYGMLDEGFHVIIDEAYKIHLASTFLAFGTALGKIQVPGATELNWVESFAAYRKYICVKIKDWSADSDRPMVYRPQLSLLEERVKYLLDTAYSKYPFVMFLGTALPLMSKTFILEVGQHIHTNQDGIIDVSHNIFMNFTNITIYS